VAELDHTLEPGDIAPPAPITGPELVMDGDKSSSRRKVGTLHFNVKDELKRTWARTTRLQHKESGKEGAHTPQLAASTPQ